MRKVLGVATAMIVSIGTSALAAEQGLTKIAQASTESGAPAATPAPATPAATPAPGAGAPAAPSAPSATPGSAATTPAAAPAAAPAAPPAAQAPAAKLVGVAAWGQLVGNSITGNEGGKTLTEYYAPDGTAKSMSGNEVSTGNWMLMGEVICFKYSDDPKPECYKLEISGDTATLTDEKGTGTRYQIVKGNPKGL